MKQINILFSAALLCASAATICSCSNTDDEFAPATQEESLKVITVGAPTIKTADNGTTRVTFEDNNGLEMSWEASDPIGISSFYVKDNSFNRMQSKEFTAVNAGTSTTFSGTDLDDGKKTGDYVISYGFQYGSSYSSYNSWKTQTIASTQTQSGNDNTAHLKANYRAFLLNVNTYENPTFSQTWASAHAVTSIAAHTQVNSETGTVPDSELGKFIQSSCLKLDLSLPFEVRNVTKVELVASSAVFNTDCSGTKTTTLTLNFSGLSSDYTTNLIGYIMMPAAETDLSNAIVTVKVWYGSGENDYISRALTFPADTKLAAGTLGSIKLNASNWTPIIWTFTGIDSKLTGLTSDNGTHPTYSSTSSTATLFRNGLYVETASGNAQKIRILNNYKASSSFGDGIAALSTTNMIQTQRTSAFEDSFFNSFRDASSANGTNAGTIAINVSQAGTLYVSARTADDADATDNTKFMKIYYQNKSSKAKTEASLAATKSLTNLSLASTGEGVYYIFAVNTKMEISAIKFVPSE